MASSSSSGKKRKRKKLSIYEQIAREEKLKWDHDDIYMMMMNPDTTKIDKELKIWREETLAKYPKLSSRFKRNTRTAIFAPKRLHHERHRKLGAVCINDSDCESRHFSEF